MESKSGGCDVTVTEREKERVDGMDWANQIKHIGNQTP